MGGNSGIGGIGGMGGAGFSNMGGGSGISECVGSGVGIGRTGGSSMGDDMGGDAVAECGMGGDVALVGSGGISAYLRVRGHFLDFYMELAREAYDLTFIDDGDGMALIDWTTADQYGFRVQAALLEYEADSPASLARPTN